MIIPEENMKDLQEIPDNVKEGLEITPVKWIDQVLVIALERQPEPLPGAEPVAGTDADEALADVPPVAKAKRATRSKRQATKH